MKDKYEAFKEAFSDPNVVGKVYKVLMEVNQSDIMSVIEETLWKSVKICKDYIETYNTTCMYDIMKDIQEIKYVAMDSINLQSIVNIYPESSNSEAKRIEKDMLDKAENRYNIFSQMIYNTKRHCYKLSGIEEETIELLFDRINELYEIYDNIYQLYYCIMYKYRKQFDALYPFTLYYFKKSIDDTMQMLCDICPNCVSAKYYKNKLNTQSMHSILD